MARLGRAHDSRWFGRAGAFFTHLGVKELQVTLRAHCYFFAFSSTQVKLRGFSTNVHRVDASVAYRLGEDAA